MNKEKRLFELLTLLLSHLEKFDDPVLDDLKNEVQKVLMLKLSESA